MLAQVLLGYFSLGRASSVEVMLGTVKPG